LGTFYLVRTRKRRQDCPSAIGVRVRHVLQDLIGSAKVRECEAILAWQEVVGEAVARRTRAERLRGGTLHVRVATSAFANELSMMKPEILARLRPRVGGQPITDVRYTVGLVDS
jgi:predicted nucleic acid-binding Zn ribbon protein